MSTFSQFAGGGGGIKSIQRGVITLSAVGSNTATVTAVNTAKAQLRVLGAPGVHAFDTYLYVSPDAYAVLTNSTTITATRPMNFGTTYLSWELTEWN